MWRLVLAFILLSESSRMATSAEIAERVTNMKDVEGRRPLKVRSAAGAQKLASWLSQRNITPNQISVASIGFAGLAALCLMVVSRYSEISVFALFILAAFCIQMRLLCNLFDGMVAVEGGKSTASGELFNDIPDRISDPLILFASGFAISGTDWGAAIGGLAAILSVLTAYIRTLASSLGAPVDFSGPMAKQHRMAVLTIALVVTAFERVFLQSDFVLTGALSIIVLGSFVTLYNRTRNAYNHLES